MPKRKRKRIDQRHMVGIMNHGSSARFVLVLDTSTKTYDITILKPNQLSFTFLPEGRRQVKTIYELFDSMDDLHQGISELARGYKESKADHRHCWKGGKEHVHQVDDLGVAIGECPTKPGTCGESCRPQKH